MLKVMTILGTRPEIIKMSRVISEFDLYTHHTLVHTGQNYDYELNEIFFEDLGIRRPDFFLNAASETSAKSIAKVIEKTDEILTKEAPNAVLLYGDTNSCMAVISAKRHKVPIFHMEAGNRCFDQRVPEELNRKIIDHLSDINLVLTENARSNLIMEGIRPEYIIKTGSHMSEVLDFYLPQIEKSNILNEMGLKPKSYFIVSAHREENVDSEINLRDLLETLNALAEKYNFPVVISTHPRTKKRLDNLPNLTLDPRIIFMKPFGFSNYMRLQLDSACVISDSGSLTEEAAIMNLPAIAIRNTHERQEGMDAGVLIMSGLKKTRVLDSVSIILSQRKNKNFIYSRISDYESKFVSKKILRIVMSYTEYVNSNIWRK